MGNKIPSIMKPKKPLKLSMMNCRLSHTSCEYVTSVFLWILTPPDLGSESSKRRVWGGGGGGFTIEAPMRALAVHQCVIRGTVYHFKGLENEHCFLYYSNV